MQTRRHANGAAAQVSDAAYLGRWSAFVWQPGVVQTAGSYKTVEAAKVAADHHAHPGCDGDGCGVWTSEPRATTTPPRVPSNSTSFAIAQAEEYRGY